MTPIGRPTLPRRGYPPWYQRPWIFVGSAIGAQLILLLAASVAFDDTFRRVVIPLLVFIGFGAVLAQTLLGQDEDVVMIRLILAANLADVSTAIARHHIWLVPAPTPITERSVPLHKPISNAPPANSTGIGAYTPTYQVH